MNKEIEFKIEEQDSNRRLDAFLTEKINNKSRNYIQKAIKQNQVLVNGKPEKISYRLRVDDVIHFTYLEFMPLQLEAEDIPLDIIYEDDQLLVINKPRGMVVHPSNGHHEGTLVNALLNHCKKLSSLNGTFRPGIVHRIDKDTSGLLVVAKNDEAHRFLQEQLKDKTMHREYYAIVEGGIPSDDFKIIAPLGPDKNNHLKRAVDLVNGKEAVTYGHVEERFGLYTLVSLRLETGRTHQIRVHMAYIRHPVVGDTIYGYKEQPLTDKGQMLHAYQITFIHPTTKKPMTFTCPVDKEFQRVLDLLREKKMLYR